MQPWYAGTDSVNVLPRLKVKRARLQRLLPFGEQRQALVAIFSCLSNKSSRQKGSFCRYSLEPLPCFQEFVGRQTGRTLDKMMKARKTTKSARRASGWDGRKKTGWDADSGRKHLTGREVELLIGAVKGSRNELRDRCLLLLMFRH